MVVQDYFLPLTTAWSDEEYRLPDYMRGMDFLGGLVMRPDTLFVKVEEDAWIVFIGASDNVTTIVLGHPSPAISRRILKKALQATGSTRLTAMVPAPAVDYHALMKEIGFKSEGRMVDALVWDHESTDAYVMGFYANAKKGRKRKRRSRRA